MIEKVKFFKVGEREWEARIKDSGCLRTKVRRKLKINYLPLSELTLSSHPSLILYPFGSVITLSTPPAVPVCSYSLAGLKITFLSY